MDRLQAYQEKMADTTYIGQRLQPGLSLISSVIFEQRCNAGCWQRERLDVR